MNRSLEILQELKKKGYKVTRQREAIISVLGEVEHQLLTAQEIFEKILGMGSATNFSTVYRNLEMLLQEEIIRKVELNRDAAYYELNYSGDHHHHLICKKCGSIQTTSFCPLERLGDEDGFIPVEHKFEIYGYCKECVKTDSTIDRELISKSD
ncbi:MAG TPA: transcriptional repressor [Clostridiales bacterium]|nr:transcriptional repressor [Clostridiales bacterium]